MIYDQKQLKQYKTTQKIKVYRLFVISRNILDLQFKIAKNKRLHCSY